MAKAPELKLKVGDKAPDFHVDSSTGRKLSLSEFSGRWVVLYFYPKDDTPGCTREACSFRDSYSRFQKAGAVVLGVSTDPTSAHAKFISKYKLPFILLADTEKEIVKKYGVWGQKSFMGRKYEGTHRVTFLVGSDAEIKRIWSTVKPEEHADEVYAAINEESA